MAAAKATEQMESQARSIHGQAEWDCFTSGLLIKGVVLWNNPRVYCKDLSLELI